VLLGPILFSTRYRRLPPSVGAVINIYNGADIDNNLLTTLSFADVRDVAETAMRVVDVSPRKHSYGRNSFEEALKPQNQTLDGQNILIGERFGGSQQIADILRTLFPTRRSIIKEGNQGSYDRTDNFDCTRARALAQIRGSEAKPGTIGMR
jgi:hypothetical protein